MEKTRAAFILFLLSLFLGGVAFLLFRPPAGPPVGPVPSAQREADRPRTRPPIPDKPKPAEPSTAPSTVPEAGPETASGPVYAAVIIDDLGYNLDAIRVLCEMGRPVTAAILPFASHSKESAEMAAGCGLETMLHLPLESITPTEHSAGRISSGMSAEEVEARVLECLGEVPGCRGVNNHEGSRTTGDAVMMPMILSVLRERGLYFVDSMTTPESVAFETARRMGVPAAMRRVFLDQNTNDEWIRARILDLFRAARRYGRAVGIGHARPETLAALRKYLGLAPDFGVTLVAASHIVE
jgi:polysaccharide deacetylase 2 family uncharacterized protein YibQ